VQPYVIRQGEFLRRIAYKFGFDPDVVWNDSANDDLRKLRPNPNVLFAGDVLYIPDDTPPVVHPLVTGSTNAFQAPDPPPVTVVAKFVGDEPDAYASKAYTVEELDQLTGLTTDGEGTVNFPAPVTLETATVVFTETGERFPLQIGWMDPIDTMYGVFMRLMNLAYVDPNATFDEEDVANNLETIRVGLRSLKVAQDGASGDGADASASDDASAQAGDDDNDGIDDDGNLSADMSDRLKRAHGH
jgi:hypothetical protein